MNYTAHVEFVNHKTLRITTAFKQKEFDLTNESADTRFDLINLKKLKYTADKFSARLCGKGTIDDPFNLMVYCRTGHNADDWDYLDSVFPADKVKTFKVYIP